MAKVVCVLYDDPVTGYPKSYARDSIPEIEKYSDGQTIPSPQKIDFVPGALLGSVTGALGLRKFLEESGHTLIVTSDKDGTDSVFERELLDADIVISQPFWPAYLTEERIAKAKNLKLAITAGIGSDHVDLEAAMNKGITVAEITYCNSISTAEHAVMMILALVRNYLPSYEWVTKKGWNIADCVERSYDLEGMNVGIVGAGRIGSAVLKRLKPFDVKLHYTDTHRLPEDVETSLGVTYHPTVESMVGICDVVSIHCPLHPKTEHLFNDALIGKMKRGAYIVNTAAARSAIATRLFGLLKAGESPAMRGTSGSLNLPQGASMANNATPGDDTAYRGNEPTRSGPLRRWRKRNPRVLVCEARHPKRIPHR